MSGQNCVCKWIDACERKHDTAYCGPSCAGYDFTTPLPNAEKCDCVGFPCEHTSGDIPFPNAEPPNTGSVELNDDTPAGCCPDCKAHIDVSCLRDNLRSMLLNYGRMKEFIERATLDMNGYNDDQAVNVVHGYALEAHDLLKSINEARG